MGRHEMLKTTVRGCVGVRTNSRKSVRISTVFRKHNNRRLEEGITEKYYTTIITTTLIESRILYYLGNNNYEIAINISDMINVYTIIKE